MFHQLYNIINLFYMLHHFDLAWQGKKSLSSSFSGAISTIYYGWLALSIKLEIFLKVGTWQGKVHFPVCVDPSQPQTAKLCHKLSINIKYNGILILPKHHEVGCRALFVCFEVAFQNQKSCWHWFLYGT